MSQDKKAKLSVDEQERRDREDKRIANQRNLFMFLPVTASVDALKKGMLQRAYDLMWDGEAEQADAIMEFLPSRDVNQMLDAWLDDFTTDDAAPKSEWHRQ